MISVRSTSRTEARMVVVWSIGNGYVDGLRKLRPSTAERVARIRSTVSIILAPGLAENNDQHAGLPFK